MGDWAKKAMKQIEDNLRSSIKISIENSLKPLQNEIKKEGAIVKIIPQKNIDKPFNISIEGASKELENKILNAIKSK